jgi:hypothetical protein
VITIERFFAGHMLAAVAALAIGLAASDVAPLACSLVVVLLGLVWYASQQRRAAGGEGLMLFAFVFSAGLGFYLNAPAWILLIGVVASTGAWDLDHFLQRLSLADRIELESGLGREHLRRLLVVEAVGLLAGLAALVFQTRISFWWEALLVLLVVIGLSRIIARVRKETGG